MAALCALVRLGVSATQTTATACLNGQKRRESVPRLGCPRAQWPKKKGVCSTTGLPQMASCTAKPVMPTGTRRRYKQGAVKARGAVTARGAVKARGADVGPKFGSPRGVYTHRCSPMLDLGQLHVACREVLGILSEWVEAWCTARAQPCGRGKRATEQDARPRCSGCGAPMRSSEFCGGCLRHRSPPLATRHKG